LGGENTGEKLVKVMKQAESLSLIALPVIVFEFLEVDQTTGGSKVMALESEMGMAVYAA
jgi:hypothetical protein